MVSETDTAQDAADYAAQKVARQRRIVSLMLPDDPALSYAKTVLRQMEQSAAMAEMNAVIASLNRDHGRQIMPRVDLISL